jgi:hypothetical protein
MCVFVMSASYLDQFDPVDQSRSGNRTLSSMIAPRLVPLPSVVCLADKTNDRPRSIITLS